MSVKVCPSCGHEIYDRGRFCQFCGCELKGGVTAPAAEGTRSGNSGREDENIWNPEKAYGNSRRRTALWAILLAVLAAVAAFVLVRYGIYANRSGMPADLRAGMSFRQAREVMRKEGFVEEGVPYESGKLHALQYDSREALGIRTEYSVLELRDGEYAALVHMYYEVERGSMAHPGPVFVQLKNALSKAMGSEGNPEEGTAQYLIWRKDRRTVMLSYAAADEVQLVIYYTEDPQDL